MVGSGGARRNGRAVNVARAGEPALRANDPYRSLPLPFPGLNFAYLSELEA